jgi:hypothetical protein
MVWYITSLNDRLDPRNCPQTGPVALRSLILDATDPLAPIPMDDVKRQLRAYLTDEVKDGEGITIWRVAGPNGRSEPDVALICRPPVPDNPLISNRKMAERRFAERYVDPLMRAMDAALGAPRERWSAIMETLQRARIHNLGQFTDGRRLPIRIVLVSDLAQNTAELSFEANVPTFSGFRQSPAYVMLSPGDLTGIDVVVYRISRRRHLGDAARLEMFWKALVETHHGAFGIRPVTGRSES